MNIKRLLLIKENQIFLGFCGGSDGKASACNAGDVGLIPGVGRSPGEENRNALQCPCWEIPQTEELSRTQLSD